MTSCYFSSNLKNIKTTPLSKYIKLKITSGDNKLSDEDVTYHVQTGETKYRAPVCEAQIEFDGKIIGNFFTKWYFYNKDQFCTNDFVHRLVEKIQQIPLSSQIGEVLVRVKKDENDNKFKFAICDEKGNIDDKYEMIDPAYISYADSKLNKIDLGLYQDKKHPPFVIKKGGELEHFNEFYVAELYKNDESSQKLGMFPMEYGVCFPKDEKCIVLNYIDGSFLEFDDKNHYSESGNEDPYVFPVLSEYNKDGHKYVFINAYPTQSGILLGMPTPNGQINSDFYDQLDEIFDNCKIDTSQVL